MVVMRFRGSPRDGNLLCWGNEWRLDKGMGVQLRDEGTVSVDCAGGRNGDSPRL